MITDITSSRTTQLPAAAGAVCAAWGMTGTLTVGRPSRDVPTNAPNGQAVVVSFTGPIAGRLVIAVDESLAAELMASPAAPPDLQAGLEPAVTAACLALGDIVPEQVQLLDARGALRQISTAADTGVILLSTGDSPRAVVAIGTDSQVSPQATGNRLEMLRGVQMQATVELGRATMTINDLLSLRAGTVVELDRSAGAPADLYVNGRLIAHGEVVVIDENYGLRVMQVVSDEPGR